MSVLSPLIIFDQNQTEILITFAQPINDYENENRSNQGIVFPKHYCFKKLLLFFKDIY